MEISLQTLQNAVQLLKFEELQKKGEKPSLAVYRGREIVVIKDEGGVIGCIKWLWRKFQSSIGLLSTDEKVLKKLEDVVSHGAVSLGRWDLEGKLKKLQAELMEKQNIASDLQVKTSGLESKVAELKKVDEALKAKQKEIKEHTCHLEQCANAKDEIQSLEDEKAHLQEEVKKVKDSYKKVQPKKEELENLTKAVSELEGQRQALLTDVEQLDFKKRYAQLVATEEHLLNEAEAMNIQIKALTEERAFNHATIEGLKAQVEANAHNSQHQIQSLKAEIAWLRSKEAGERVPVGSSDGQHSCGRVRVGSKKS